MVTSEAAQRPALAASHYIEGHALTLRKKNLHTGRDQAYSQLIVSRAAPHSYAALEWGVVPWHAKVETATKKKLA